MIEPNDVEALSDLVRARNSLMYSMARYESGALNLYETDSDHKTSHVRIPSELALDLLGAALGLVNARLIAKGVTVAEITERECFDCAGTGTASKT